MEGWLSSKPPGWLDRWLAYSALEAEAAGEAGGDKAEMVTPEQALLQLRMGFGDARA